MKIGILGAGRWGFNLIRNFASLPDIELLVFDPNETSLKRITFNTQIKKANSIDEIYGSDIDAVVIATPISTHFEFASRAIQSNKHVFIEKPITSTWKEALELKQMMINLNYKKTLMVGHIFLYNPAFLKVKEIVNSGELGDIRHIFSTRLNFGPIRTDVDAVIDIATHDISMCNYLFGYSPDEVSATSAGWISGKMDVCMSSLKYGDALVYIYSSWYTPEKEQKFTIVGSKKMLVFDNLNSFEPVKVYNKSVITQFPDNIGTFIPKLNDEEILIPKIAAVEPLKTECEWFIDCIKGNKIPRSDIDEASKVMNIIDAIRESYKIGGTVCL